MLLIFTCPVHQVEDHPQSRPPFQLCPRPLRPVGFPRWPFHHPPRSKRSLSNITEKETTFTSKKSSCFQQRTGITFFTFRERLYRLNLSFHFHDIRLSYLVSNICSTLAIPLNFAHLLLDLGPNSSKNTIN